MPRSIAPRDHGQQQPGADALPVPRRVDRQRGDVALADDSIIPA